MSTSSPACSSRPARKPQTKPVLGERRAPAGEKKLDGSVHFNDLAHILFDQAPAGRGRPAGRPGGLRQAGECAVGVILKKEIASGARGIGASSYENRVNGPGGMGNPAGFCQACGYCGSSGGMEP